MNKVEGEAKMCEKKTQKLAGMGQENIRTGWGREKKEWEGNGGKDGMGGNSWKKECKKKDKGKTE